MRRTYKSKKDTGGALDHRDVLQNMDEKSSAFDAFYIQNIKQTKRELSCIGSSNPLGVASNKVRKRKYVKRIVKEVENQPQESMSTSAYLTPDKSLRVNKILDPFDMLLNSSTTGQVAKVKNDVFDQFLSTRKRKTYTKRKVKKINYSSDYSSDSDKENLSHKESNKTDIRMHDLLVEREPSNSPKYFDESIYKIDNNLSLINNFKRKTANSTFNTSYRHGNRLIKNCQSPNPYKSPLCSTPFKEKYRGKSIYNFSPISSKEESPNSVTIMEENNESSDSIVFLCKGKVSKLSKEQPSATTTNHIPGDENMCNNNESLIYEDDIEHNLENDEKKEHQFDPSFSNSKLNNTSATIAEFSLYQISEAEPFLGFPGEKFTESVTKANEYLSKCIQKHNLEDVKGNETCNDKSIIEVSVNGKCSLHCVNSFENENVTIYKIDNKTDKDISIMNKMENIHSETKAEEKIHYEIQNSNILLNTDKIVEDSTNSQHLEYTNLSESQYDKTDNNISLDRIDFNQTSARHSNNCTPDSHNESMYDTCNESYSEDEDINMKEPKVFIEKMSDSMFMKYYEKMKSEPILLTINSHNEMDNIPNDQVINQTRNADDETSTSFYNYSKDDISTAVTTESDYIETQPNEIIITDSSTTEDLESNDEETESEERFISFVTTRRRNEITNDSMFIFDHSYGSSNTDCDTTVLSNKKENEKCELDLDNVNKCETSGLNENGDNQDRKDEYSTDSEIYKITIRKSPKLSGHIDVNGELNSSIHECTIIGIKDSDDECKAPIKEIPSPNQTLKCNSPEPVARSSVAVRNNCRSNRHSIHSDISKLDTEVKQNIVLQPGKKWERSLSIYRRMTTMADHFDQSILDNESQKKGRKYRQSVISTMEMQDSLYNESINSRRSTFTSKPSRPTIRFVKDTSSRISLNTTTEDFEDLKGFLTEECDDTVIEISKLSLADSEFEVTVLDNFHETSGRVATARDYVLRRCNQLDPILFDECYPETVLKNCHKIGEGVYGEVFLWRARDGRARVMKIVPIAGSLKVNGEDQKDFHEIISEIVIAMELSALRAPIADIDRYFDEGKEIEALDLHSVENATDVFNEVLAVRCVQGPYPSRLLDLWELYDECKGSENDNPASLPPDQQYIVLELANAGQDLESYQFTGAQQAHALFQQIAFGLAVGEEAFQFEHRDLHWGNVLIAPTEQKLATFVLRGRTYRLPRGGVAATIIDYSLSRISLPAGGERAALYNDLATDDQLFDAVGDYQFEVYRLMRDKCRNDWKNFEPYTNILWLHYTVDKMITALRYKRTNTKIHKHYIEKLKGIRDRLLDYKSATEYVLTDIEI